MHDGNAVRDFDAIVDEGTFEDYEVFGVYSGDATGDSIPDYEIFIISSGCGI